MGKCKDCKGWSRPNCLSDYGKCSSRKFHADVIPQYQKTTLEVHQDFGCIHFERRGKNARRNKGQEGRN